jgi:hypothetical protein
MLHILRTLDQHRFLGFAIWEFSFRSLTRLYGRIFLRDIVLQHPLRTLEGVLAYQRFSRQGWSPGEVTHLYTGTQADLQTEIAEADGGFLVALGFCQKPLGPPGSGCPAGRFTHQCYVLVGNDVLEAQVERLPLPCRECDVRLIGTAALRAGAAVYIMTSAADIARQLFIPTLERDRFRYGLFLQCPYSIPAMALPLLICGIRSVLVGYAEGDCRDYPQFLLADEGTKDERTCLNPLAQAYVLDFLRDIASARQTGERHYCRFRCEGPLYVPVLKT